MEKHLFSHRRQYCLKIVNHNISNIPKKIKGLFGCNYIIGNHGRFLWQQTSVFVDFAPQGKLHKDGDRFSASHSTKILVLKGTIRYNDNKS